MVGVACGSNGSGSDTKETATPQTNATPQENVTPAVAASAVSPGVLDDVIDLAVQLGTMTREQAVCVFQLHPNIYQEFLQTSGLTTSGSADTATVKQQLEDLKRKHAVQLDGCFTDRGG